MTTTAAMESFDRLRSALITKFPPGTVDEALFFFNKLRQEARYEHWVSCIDNGGRFVETLLKCFHHLRTDVEVDSINVNEEIKALEQTTVLSDSERLIIPHALRLIYDFRNRLGGIHNSSFDPVKIDCVQLVSLCKWVVEELTRLYLTNDAAAAQVLVDNLLVKESSLVQEFDGDPVVLPSGLSARVYLEVLLRWRYSERCSIKDLEQWAHNHTIHNIRVTLHEMQKKNLVHVTEAGWILTEKGIDEANAEMIKLKNGDDSPKTVRKSRAKGAKRGRK